MRASDRRRLSLAPPGASWLRDAAVYKQTAAANEPVSNKVVTGSSSIGADSASCRRLLCSRPSPFISHHHQASLFSVPAHRGLNPWLSGCESTLMRFVAVSRSWAQAQRPSCQTVSIVNHKRGVVQKIFHLFMQISARLLLSLCWATD